MAAPTAPLHPRIPDILQAVNDGNFDAVIDIANEMRYDRDGIRIPPHRISPHTVARVRMMHASGISIASIARHFCITRPTIYKIIRNEPPYQE